MFSQRLEHNRVFWGEAEKQFLHAEANMTFHHMLFQYYLIFVPEVCISKKLSLFSIEPDLNLCALWQHEKWVCSCNMRNEYAHATCNLWLKYIICWLSYIKLNKTYTGKFTWCTHVYLHHLEHQNVCFWIYQKLTNCKEVLIIIHLKVW